MPCFNPHGTGRNSLGGQRPLLTTLIFVMMICPLLSRKHWAAPFVFSAPIDFPFATNAFLWLASGEFTQDGRPDIIVGTTNILSLAHGNGDGTFSLLTNLVSDGPFHSIAVIDWDTNRTVDFVAANSDFFLYQGTNGTLTLSWRNPSSLYTPVIAADFNNDGRPELKSLGLGLAGAAADFDADGTNDLAITSVTNPNNPSGLSVSLSSRRFFTYLPGYDVKSYSIKAADFDHDGDLDIAMANQSADRIILAYNDGSGQFSTLTNYSSPVLQPVALGIADFDHDGWLDIAVRGLSGSVGILKGETNGFTGTTILQQSGVASPGIPGNSLIVDDFNSDGFADLAAIVNGAVRSWLNLSSPDFKAELKIKTIEDLIELRWNTNYASGSVLEVTTRLGAQSNSWEPVPFPPISSGQDNIVFQSIKNASAFFRLKRTGTN